MRNEASLRKISKERIRVSRCRAAGQPDHWLILQRLQLNDLAIGQAVRLRKNQDERLFVDPLDVDPFCRCRHSHKAKIQAALMERLQLARSVHVLESQLQVRITLTEHLDQLWKHNMDC